MVEGLKKKVLEKTQEKIKKDYMIKRNLRINIDGDVTAPAAQLSLRPSVRAGSTRAKVFQHKFEKPINMDDMNTFDGRFGDMMGRDANKAPKMSVRRQTKKIKAKVEAVVDDVVPTEYDHEEDYGEEYGNEFFIEGYS